MNSRKRILFLAEGATMAHFVRPLSLAASLPADRYEIHFYAPARFSRFLEGQNFTTGHLSSMPGEQFLANLAKGAPLFGADVIRRYVAEDRELMRSLRPDLVIGDMRLSLPISAPLEKTPYAVLFNAYWSPYAKPRSVIPSVPLTKVLPPRWFSGLYRLLEPVAFRIHAAEMNKVRREFGIADLPPDPRVMYTEGDYVLYPDIPEFVPTPGRPANHRYVGICPWSPAAALPEWWERMRADPKSKVFVSLGSSGPLQVIPGLLRTLSRLSVSVILSSSGRSIPGAPAGVYQADLLPFTETALESRVVVSHGGSGGLYPATAAGAPVLGIPSNADQHMSTAVLEENGAGLGIRVEEASEKRIAQAVEKLLFDPQYRQSAERWSTIFARYDSGAMFREFLEGVLG